MLQRLGFGLATTVLLACGGSSDGLCGDLIEDRVLGRCVCPPDTTPSEDGWSCLLPDGGVIVDPSAPGDASTRFPSDGGMSDGGQADTGPSCPEGDGCIVGGAAGRCRGGACVALGCGDETVGDGEDCDDGANGDDTDGCTDACRFTCVVDVDCADGNLCNGTERCDGAHLCRAGTPLDCDDRDNCTADACDETTGCSNVLIDGDGDGYAPAALGTCTTDPTASRDCDDGDETRHPGAAELCNERDEDCDDRIDESGTDLECFRDADGDGYPNTALRILGCTCPSGYIVARTDGLTDCADTVPEANPGATMFRTDGYSSSGGISFDWNCDGVETDELGNRVGPPTCATTFPGSGVCRPYQAGWVALPQCGDEGTIDACRGSAVQCTATTVVATRTCR